MKTVDIVVPCFNEEAMLSMFYTESEKIYKTIDGYDFTYIFVNDGSKDNTYLMLKKLASEHSNVKYISFPFSASILVSFVSGILYPLRSC